MIEMSEINETQVASFWAKVKRGPETECWNWTAARSSLGYGKFMIKKRPRYRSFKAHRLAYYLTHGAFDESFVVMHKCDNPSCCNPAHLLLGTMKDNMADMWRKGRARVRPNYGEKNGLAKLTEDAVRLIRRSTETTAELARRYGVSGVLIGQVRRGRIWKHVQ